MTKTLCSALNEAVASIEVGAKGLHDGAGRDTEISE
jgi:hypothetical protein